MAPVLERTFAKCELVKFLSETGPWGSITNARGILNILILYVV